LHQPPRCSTVITCVFAIGKALEDQGSFAESFGAYQQGNELKRPECRYRAELAEQNTQQQIKICTAEFFASRQGWGNPSPDPIFIIGLPRSGSTLLEQILASHSQVEGTQELPNVQQIVSRLRGFGPETDDPRYPRILASLSTEDFRKLGEEYLAGTRIYRSGRAFFIDKMPNNFRHVGLIHLMLPNARIIDARREPMACCFSNFKQLFANGQEFTYSIDDIARYYRTYLELMRHWDQVLPDAYCVCTTKMSSMTSKAASVACWSTAGLSSRRNVLHSMKLSAACVPRARSRYGRESFVGVSTNGRTLSPGSDP